MKWSSQVLQPRPPGRPGDGFAPAKVLIEVPLAMSTAQSGGSAKAAAIAAGTIDTPPGGELVRPFYKQVCRISGFTVAVVIRQHGK